MPEANDTLDQIDLRSLRLLVRLVDLKSVTRAGEAVRMSQPAASRTLAVLRRMLGDPLLVRTANGYATTPRAEMAAMEAARALDAAGSALAKTAFEPATSTRSVSIATTDYGAIVVLGPLLSLLEAEAPSMTVVAVPWSASTPSDMEAGRVDLALYADGDLPGDFLRLELFRETYCAVVRESHPVLAEPDPEASLLHLPRIVTTYPDGRMTLIDDPLQERGARAPPRLVLPYFTAAATLAAKSNMVTCLPSRVAQSIAGLSRIEVPNANGFDYRVTWHRRVHADTALGWVRQAMLRAIQGAVRRNVASCASSRVS